MRWLRQAELPMRTHVRCRHAGECNKHCDFTRSGELKLSHRIEIVVLSAVEHLLALAVGTALLNLSLLEFRASGASADIGVNEWKLLC